jgi:hypothetical protein
MNPRKFQLAMRMLDIVERIMLSAGDGDTLDATPPVVAVKTGEPKPTAFVDKAFEDGLNSIIGQFVRTEPPEGQATRIDVGDDDGDEAEDLLE